MFSFNFHFLFKLQENGVKLHFKAGFELRNLDSIMFHKKIFLWAK